MMPGSLQSLLNLVLLGCYSLTVFASPQDDRGPVSLDTAVSASQVQIAEPIQLTWTLFAPPGARVVLPPLGKQLNEFEVVDTQDLLDLPIENSNQRCWIRRVTLESLVAGDLKIPAVEFQVVMQGRPQLIRTEEIPLRVLSVLEDRADPTKYHDIHSVIDVPSLPTSQFIDGLWWPIAGVTLLMIAAAVLVVVHRRQRWLTPADWARQQIRELSQLYKADGADPALMANRLATVLKGYFEKLLQLPASAQTSHELVAVMQQRQLLPADQIANLQQLLAVLDMNQFAGLPWSDSELIQTLEQALQLVEATSPAGFGQDGPALARAEGA